MELTPRTGPQADGTPDGSDGATRTASRPGAPRKRRLPAMIVLVLIVVAGGFVVLTVGHAPWKSPSGLRDWYLAHRLLPLSDAGRTVDPHGRGADEPADLPQGAQHVRFHLLREGIPMVRDVYFLPGAIGSGRALVMSLECPRWWAERYVETRRALVGSLRLQRPGAPANGVTRVSVAAIE